MMGHFHWMTAPVLHNIHCFAIGCPSYTRRRPLQRYAPHSGHDWTDSPILLVEDDFWRLKPSERMARLAESLAVGQEWEAISDLLSESECRKLFDSYDLEDFGLSLGQ